MPQTARWMNTLLFIAVLPAENTMRFPTYGVPNRQREKPRADTIRVHFLWESIRNNAQVLAESPSAPFLIQAS